MRSLNLLVSIQLSAVSGQPSVVSGQPLAFGISSSANRCSLTMRSLNVILSITQE
ncbi:MULTISPECIES: hypothetical protein [unclassified Moorena]|uniref:hypothetical protein n=1 Tax=unclassified Moorena TaxID=2683338 RepID=UPI0014008A24|nr:MULTISPECIES: hypothetical protein [unclassified Moorena]NEO16291.1 hypothetical protein [Moorena sp. SIO3E8]NEO45416.1 hypothetical protein [Moorena sp. SIO4A3]NEQ02829.1 hypothetical protein [Moorena sp. SIO3F7]